MDFTIKKQTFPLRGEEIEAVKKKSHSRKIIHSAYSRCLYLIYV